MRKLSLVVLFALAGCPNKGPQPKAVNNDPYKDVTPQKVKEKVEATQKKEDEHNDQIVDKAMKE
jgi:hypothetical protein